MSLRRAVLLALVLYVSADYCDPSIPGVFSFGTETFFVDSVDSRSSGREPRPLRTSPWRPLDTVMLSQAPLGNAVRPSSREQARAERQPYVPRAHVMTSSPAAPGAAEDH
jgi:hypothetical protein